MNKIMTMMMMMKMKIIMQINTMNKNIVLTKSTNYIKKITLYVLIAKHGLIILGIRIEMLL